MSGVRKSSNGEADRSSETRSPRVDFLTGSVFVGGERRSLSDGNAQLAFALGRQRYASTREQIIETLWPSTREPAAVNAFNLCVHHVRRRLGASSVVWSCSGYRLSDDATVDLWEFERELADARTGRIHTEQRAWLRSVQLRLRVPLPAQLCAWEWFSPTARRIESLRCALAERLAHDALGNGEPAIALDMAHDILDRDDFDEPARVIVIRAHLALGDEASALRTFRHYRDLVSRELGFAPSLSFDRLTREYLRESASSTERV